MKRSKLPSLAFMAMLALTTIGATTATAETLPNILPLGSATSPLEAQGISGISKFGIGLTEVESSSDTGTSSATSEKSGPYHISFLESKAALLGQCQGIGDAAGIILVLGQFHIRDAKEGGTLITAVEGLLEQVHFSCGGVPIIVEGCAAGRLDSGTELASTLTVLLKVKGSDNEILTVLNEENAKEEACQLLASVNGGKTELASQEQTITIEKFSKEGKAGQVLVMPL